MEELGSSGCVGDARCPMVRGEDAPDATEAAPDMPPPPPWLAAPLPCGGDMSIIDIRPPEDDGGTAVVVAAVARVCGNKLASFSRCAGLSWCFCWSSVDVKTLLHRSQRNDPPLAAMRSMC